LMLLAYIVTNKDYVLLHQKISGIFQSVEVRFHLCSGLVPVNSSNGLVPPIRTTIVRVCGAVKSRTSHENTSFKFVVGRFVQLDIFEM
jgi:hypothetical protein